MPKIGARALAVNVTGNWNQFPSQADSSRSKTSLDCSPKIFFDESSLICTCYLKNSRVGGRALADNWQIKAVFI